MNIKFKALLFQAIKEIGPDDNDRGAKNATLQRFAELIIDECVQTCWTVSEEEFRGSVISECSKRMRKHFGVK